MEHSQAGKTIFIIGIGYVGEMLCDQLSKRDDVLSIIALDKEPQGEWCATIPKVTYIQHNMADDGWQDIVAEHAPDVVIHTAWQIRAMYGQSDEQWRWNVDGSGKVFDFAFLLLRSSDWFISRPPLLTLRARTIGLNTCLPKQKDFEMMTTSMPKKKRLPKNFSRKNMMPPKQPAEPYRKYQLSAQQPSPVRVVGTCGFALAYNQHYKATSKAESSTALSQPLRRLCQRPKGGCGNLFTKMM